MKTIIRWYDLTLYLGVGIILGCTIILAKDFDMAMAVGGIIAAISVGVRIPTMWKTITKPKANNCSREP